MPAAILPAFNHHMKKYISKFHYLTQDLIYRSHAEQTQIACSAGANWIQYRCFSKCDEDMIAELHDVASICDDWGATLILTDHYHLLDKVDAQGVHIEDMQADFSVIRGHISDEKTLGASANSVEDIVRIKESAVVDYIGCGPFSTTLTKPNNYPLLGVEGYRKITTHPKLLDLDIPILAVGGVNLKDVENLLESGIYGIAVTGAINQSENPSKAVRDFYKQVY